MGPNFTFLLQNAGYDNYLIGKFINHYNEPKRMGRKNFPNGWKHFDAIIHSSTCMFYDTCFAYNGNPNVCYTGQYQTDVMTDKAMAVLK